MIGGKKALEAQTIVIYIISTLLLITAIIVAVIYGKDILEAIKNAFNFYK